MVDQEDYQTRMQRLRDATDRIEPPGGMTSRMIARVTPRSLEPSLWDMIASVGRWAILPAACAPAAIGAALMLNTSWFDEAVFIASSVGWIP